MLTAAWYLAVCINNNNHWDIKTERADNEHTCLQLARQRWRNYWDEGHEDDSKLRLQCYDEYYVQRFWVTCTKYDSCTIK